jgi:pimeloyl-ACP methyl ester carboxylesterase
MGRPELAIIHDGLAVYSFGDGEPILFMPYPHAASVVGDATPAALSNGVVCRGRRVITFDPPQAGRSTRPARLDMAEMLACADESLVCFGITGPVDVIGHSQGGIAALAFAIARPARVRRLILVGAAASGPSYLHAAGAIWNRSHPAFWRCGLIAMLLPLTRRLAAQNLMLNAIGRASYVNPAIAPRRRVCPRDWLRPAAPRIWWANVARRLDYRSALHTITAPTLVLVGRHDPQTPPVCAEELAAGIPQSHLAIFEHSGHYPFIEETDAFWATVERFLESSLPATESLPRTAGPL